MTRIRFVPRFLNGQWTVFDNFAFRTVAVRDLQSQAIKEADKRNASNTQRR